MKYDVTTLLQNFAGQTFVLKDGSDQLMTVRDAIEHALVNVSPQYVSTPAKKLEVYRLLQKVHHAEKVLELSAAEVAMIDEISGSILLITAYGALHDYLESPASGEI